MLNFADLVDENKVKLARLGSLCMGKPLRDLLATDLPYLSTTYQCEFNFTFLKRLEALWRGYD